VLGKRTITQIFTSLFYNSYLNGFLDKTIYKGDLKNICVPGINCYSCPGAIGSCPIGAFQSIVNGFKYSFTFYATGFMILFGAIFGRFICGWLCPFGFFQDILYKIPSIKKRLNRKFTYVKYFILLIFVIIIPTFVKNDFGLGNPAFCKIICPVGTLEAGIPLVLMDNGLKGLIGGLFYWKVSILVLVTLLSIVYFRFFCRFMCPLGAIYALFNKFSFFQYNLDKQKCISCGKCIKVCKMGVDITQNCSDLECIRCGDCISVCPVEAISSGFSLKSK